MKSSTLTIACSLWLACLAGAQGNLQLMTEVPVEVGSGRLTNATASPQVVWTQVVQIPTAGSLQLAFTVADLEREGDSLTVTSLADNDSQVFTQMSLKQWRNHTAWFNGGALALELRLMPGSHGEVMVGSAFLFGASMTTPAGIDTQCGATDDRTFSGDARVCRLLGNGFVCTGWLINGQNMILSAGHCGIPASTSALITAEFNVPLSTAGGQIINPPAHNQFPVDQGTIVAVQTAIGNDFSVMRLHPNVTGQTALSHQGGASFSLASSLPFYFPPFSVPTIRVTGCGADTGTANFVQQTATGPYSGAGGDVINYQVDTEGGNSGSPVIDEATGLAIGIHTNGGCGAVFGSNSGTSILNAGLQGAIANTGNCGSTVLSPGFPATISCSPHYVSTTQQTFGWTGIAVSSPFDWDIQVNTIGSFLGGSACDFVLANGHAAAVNPVSAEIQLFSGGPNATVQYAVASTAAVNVETLGFIPGSNVISLLEFNVPSAGNYDVAVNGPSTLTWHLYGPAASNAWFARGGTSFVASGVANAAPFTNVFLSAGWHCLVVFRNGGPGSGATFSASICNAVPTIALTPGVTQSIPAACATFSTTPTAGLWNVVAVSGNSDWDVFLGSGLAFSGGTVDFCASNGHNGAITPTQGTFMRYSASGTASGEHVAATSTGTVGATFDTTFGANQVVRAIEYNVPSSGQYDVNVTGPTELQWMLMAPGTTADWIPLANYAATGTVGFGSTQTVTLSAGIWLMVIIHSGGPATTLLNFTVNLCPTASVIALTPSSTGTAVTNACVPFTLAPQASTWNAVGISSAGSDWDVLVGTAESQFGGTTADYVLANGHLGVISPTAGTIVRFNGVTGATVNQATTSTLSIGSTFATSWGASQVLRIFEFNVTTAGDYDFTLTGLAGLDWDLFEPGASSAWRTRANSNLASATGGGVLTRNLGLGWHAIVVARSGGVGISGAYSVLVSQTPSPVPTLASISPTTVVAGGGAVTLTCTGTNFVSNGFAASVVQWDGVAQSTTFGSSTSLTASIPAALVAAAGTHTVTVFTPAPGGGTSGGVTFTVTNPAPTIASMAPATATAGGAAFVLTVNGSNFNSQSRVRWNGVNLTTTLVNAGQLTASVPAVNIVAAGTATISVNNPAPGGGTTGNLTFTINNPVPTATSLSPSSVIAGGASFTLTVNGTNFNAQSAVTWNGASLGTAFVSATQLQATVPAANIVAGGSASVRVVNPTPGGGTTAALTFTVNNPVPVLGSMNPASALAGTGAFTLTVTGSSFNAQSEVRWNGAPQATTFVSATQLTASISAALISAVGTASVQVRNPTPGGGNSATLTFSMVGPAITSVTPAVIAIKTLASPASTLTVNGSNFLPTSTVFGNGVALTTTFLSSTLLTASLPATVQQTRSLGGIWISVRNATTVASNFGEVIVGSGANHGTIGHVPLPDPVAPGVVYSLNIEGCVPNAPFVLSGDTGMPAPIGAWPTPAADMVLSVGSPGLFPVLDGIGVYGPAQPGIVIGPAQPGNTAPGGRFVLPGITNPNPPLGLHFTLQASYLDPASPVGFRNTWAFVNTSI